MFSWYRQSLRKLLRHSHRVNSVLLVYLVLRWIALDKIESMTNANLLVPYYFLHHTASIFQRQKLGHVIVIGSVAGIKYAPNFAMYSATKFALRALLEAFRNEIQTYNVKTTNLQPGFVATKFWDEFGPNDNKFKYEKNTFYFIFNNGIYAWWSHAIV